MFCSLDGDVSSLLEKVDILEAKVKKLERQKLQKPSPKKTAPKKK